MLIPIISNIKYFEGWTNWSINNELQTISCWPKHFGRKKAHPQAGAPLAKEEENVTKASLKLVYSMTFMISVVNGSSIHKDNNSTV